MTPSEAASVRLVNPFPGLRPFHDNEEHLFFGRESQIDTMVDKLAATRFLAVVGTSGSGKSSLVNCGLKPALSRGLMASAGTSWRMSQFRPGSDPIKAMAHSLAQPGGLFGNQDSEGLSVEEIVEATLRMSKLGLVDIYEQAQFDERPNLLVIVDQFEELFRYRNLQASSEARPGGEDRSVAFVNLLLEAASSDVPDLRCPHHAVGLSWRLLAVYRPAGSDQSRTVPGSAHVARRATVRHRRTSGGCGRSKSAPCF